MDARLAVLISGAVAVLAALAIFVTLSARRKQRTPNVQSSLLEMSAFSFLCGMAAGGIALIILV